MKSNNNSGLFATLKQDLPASVVVFFVAVPLCLGIALASGAPLFSGLIAGIIGGIVVGAISNSSLGVSGPAAGLAVIVLTAIQSLQSFEIFLLAVVIGGALQIVIGLLRGGIIGYYFPSSVIKGMLTGIGIIIILKQIPHAFGYDSDYEGDLSFFQPDGENTFSELVKMLDYISPAAVLVSVISMSILILWDSVLAKKHSFFKLVQGPLVAVVAGIVYQIVTSQVAPEWAIKAEHLVSVPVPESFSDFFGQFTFPEFSAITNGEIWLVGATIAVVASLETLLCVEATDKLDPKKRVTNTNRELFAQGTGNILSGLIGGLPITQVIVRSSANIQSGGQTKLSAILHGLFLLLCVALIPMVLNMIPLAVLACILFVVGYKLAKPSLFKQMYALGWSQFLPFLVTIVGIIFTDLLKGIAMGVVVSVVILLRNTYRNSHFIKTEKSSEGNKKVKMTLAEEVTFLNKGAILNALNNLPEGTELTVDLSDSVSIDYDVLEIIDNFKKTSKEKNITVDLINRGDLKTADY
jgi:MFS superfamily sulfate permease-like transporter